MSVRSLFPPTGEIRENLPAVPPGIPVAFLGEVGKKTVCVSKLDGAYYITECKKTLSVWDRIVKLFFSIFCCLGYNQWGKKATIQHNSLHPDGNITGSYFLKNPSFEISLTHRVAISRPEKDRFNHATPEKVSIQMVNSEVSFEVLSIKPITIQKDQ